MKQKSSFSSQRIPILAFLVGVVLFGAGFWRQSSTEVLKTDAEAREKEAQRLAENIRSGQKLAQQVEDLKRLNEKIASRLTVPGDLANNQQYFYKLESDCKVKIGELKRGGVAAKAAGAYSTTPYIVSVEGPFENIFQFIRGLESGPRIARIVTVVISNPPVAGSTNVDADALIVATIEVELLSTP